MLILIISDAWHPQVNGVVRTYEDLNRHLEKDGHEVRVIGPSEFPLRRPMPGYAEIELTLFPKRRLTQMIGDFAPDTIHIATEGPLGWAARGLCLKNGWPFTTAYHTHFPDYIALRASKYIKPLYNPSKAAGIKFIKAFHGASAAVMTTTKSVEDTLHEWNFGAPLHRLTRGVNMDVFSPGPKTLFQDLPQPIALFVGRVAIEKNIEAFLTMPWAGTKIIVGDGPSLTSLKAQYPKAVFVGKKVGHDLAAHFRSANVFVFPSKTETFGIVLIEAMACGLPIAGYNVTGPADIVVEPILGAVSDDLQDAATRALNAPGSAAERYDYLKRNYTWEVATAQFLDAQNKALIPKR